MLARLEKHRRVATLVCPLAGERRYQRNWDGKCGDILRSGIYREAVSCATGFARNDQQLVDIATHSLVEIAR